MAPHRWPKSLRTISGPVLIGYGGWSVVAGGGEKMGDLPPPPAHVHDSRSSKRVIVNVNGHKFRVRAATSQML